jgi:hypothetical protein
MKKLFTIIAVVAMSLVAMAQTNQLVWSNGRLIYGTSIETIDSLTFGGMEDVDTLQLLLPRMLTIIQRDTITQIQHDTITQIITQIERDTIIQIERDTIIKFDTIYVNNGGAELTYELRTLTFEDADAKFAPYALSYCNANITKWSDLIAKPEYGADMLYAMMTQSEDDRYAWYDEGNTFLASELPYNYYDYVFWGGGHAVSNYASSDYTTYGSYENQLTVYGKDQVYGQTLTGGYNGSANFCMHFGYKDSSPYNGTENLPYIYFKDGTPRVIDHMYVNNSTYALSCYMDGNGLTAKIGPEDWVKAVAIGYDADGNETGRAEIYLCNGPDNIVTEWTKWDLTSLGKVVKVDFNILGSSDNGYGFSQPAYFAYDNVAVRFDKE